MVGNILLCVVHFWVAVFAVLTLVPWVSPFQVELENTAVDPSKWFWESIASGNQSQGWSRLTNSVRYRACDNTGLTQSDPQPNNWLRSDRITVIEANRISVTIEFHITGCSRLPNNGGHYCDEKFGVYVNQSNQFIKDTSQYPDPVQNPSAYEKVEEISQPINTDTFETVNIVVKGRYVLLAFHNSGSCTEIYFVKVFYNVCPEETLKDSLVSLPRTVAPANESIPVEGYCDNDVVQVPGSLYVQCDSDGEWNTSGLVGKCVCKKGMQNVGGKCEASITTAPTIEASITTAPANQASITTASTTQATITSAPTTQALNSTALTNEASITTAPTNKASVTSAPITIASTTAPITEASTSTVLTTEASTKTARRTEDSKTTMYLSIIYGLAGFISLLLVLMVSFVCYFVLKRRHHPKKKEKQPVVPNTAAEYDDVVIIPMAAYQNVDVIDDAFKLDRDHITLIKVLGTGNFGQVSKAVYGTPLPEVAVKTLKANASQKDVQDMLSELEVMKSLQPHPHVVKLIGCCTDKDPLLIVLEYLPYGDLLGYLRKSRGLEDTYNTGEKRPKSRLSENDLLSFAWMIADGMNYLAMMKIVHRDLAARNVLVGENKVCKISDFGLSRGLEGDIYTKRTQTRLPVKWMPPESLFYGESSTMSDIWSYGIVMWEVFTIGESPYPGYKPRQVSGLLQTGYRMPRPRHISEELYSIMTECWQEQPQNRPTFQWLCSAVKRLLDDKKTYVNLDVYDDSEYVNFDMMTEN